MANVTMPQMPVSGAVENGRQPYMPALVSLGVLYFMMGFITCLNDTLVPYFRKGFTLSYAQSSLVQFYFFLTYGVMSIPAGKIVERIGYKKGMVWGFLVAAAGALLFYPASMLHEYAFFLSALFILAIGIVLLQVAANPYITMLGPARTASSRFTLIQGIGSLGTTVAPLFGAHFILQRLDAGSSSESVRYPYLAIALVLVLIALAVAMLKLPVIKAEQPDVQQAKGKGAFAFRHLKLGMLALFCYVGAEVAIGTFLTDYISDRMGISADAANNYVAFYWGGMLAGRLAGALLLKHVRPQRVLVGCAVAAVLLIGISVASTGYTAALAMIMVGVCNSVMFAVIFSLAVNGLGQYTTQASGMLSATIAGGAVVSYLQGMLIDNFGWTIAFMLPVLCYICITFYGVRGYKR